MTHGPVEVAFFAVSDFMNYKSGAPPLSGLPRRSGQRLAAALLALAAPAPRRTGLCKKSKKATGAEGGHAVEAGARRAARATGPPSPTPGRRAGATAAPSRSSGARAAAALGTAVACRPRRRRRPVDRGRFANKNLPRKCPKKMRALFTPMC